jgi:cytochrome c oxidase subunit 3
MDFSYDFSSMCWFRDVIREQNVGFHTISVRKGLKLGFILFIISEIMLFFAFFWAYIHSSISPTPAIGCLWPPLGIEPVNAYDILS